MVTSQQTIVVVPTTATPYITVQDYRQMPTGIDTQNLVKGDAASTDAELLNRIRAASAWADQIMRRTIPVVATVDTEMIRVPMRLDGDISIAPRDSPIISVTSFAYGTQVNNLATLQDYSNIFIDEHFFTVPLIQGFMSSAGPLQFGVPRAGSRVYCQYTYIAGWPVTVLNGAVAAGATQVVVGVSTGILPGMQIVLYDGPRTETVVVAPSYVQGSTTVPTVSPLVFPHVSGCSFSALPEDIRTAVGLLTTTLVQTRGAVAVIAPQLGALTGRLTQGGSSVKSMQREGEFVDPNVKIATDLLVPRYVRVPR